MSSTQYELFHEPRKRKDSGWWKWALAIILGALFVYRSTRPVMRLRSDPPLSFCGYGNTRSQIERKNEQRLAYAYWQVAVRHIQNYYSPDRPLPPDPPPQFRIGGLAHSSDSDATASRNHYWYRLREEWNRRNVWNVSYGWNTNWVESDVSSLPQYIPHSLSNIFQGIVFFFEGLAAKISLA